MVKLNMYVLSDSLGETGELILKACISQFGMDNYEIKRFSYVLGLDFLEKILEDAKEKRAIIAYTLVEEDLIERIKEFSAETGIHSIDLLGDILSAISDRTGLKPKREPGLIRKLNENYFKRVESIEFAVKYDDGKDPRGLAKADVVILGISRTSKTPLSMYLANKNIKVANIPLVPESLPPKEIFEIPAKRIIGLTNSPEKLNEIREERLKALGLPSGANYSDMNRILEEIDYAEKIMRKIGCPVINVSNKAIEETAEIIINTLKKNGVKLFND